MGSTRTELKMMSTLLLALLATAIGEYIPLSCSQAQNIHSIYPGHDHTVIIQNCHNTSINIFKPVSGYIPSLHLVNMTNLQLVLGPQSLSNIGQLVIIQSSLVGDMSFLTKSGADLTVENCTFQNNVEIYSLNRQRSSFYFIENVFNGGVEVLLKYISDRKRRINEGRSWLIMRENQFKKQPRIYSENMGVIFHQNIFQIPTISMIGTIIYPNHVNITNNIFETETSSKFGFHGYLKLERNLDDVSSFLDVGNVEKYGDNSIKNNVLVTYYKNST